MALIKTVSGEKFEIKDGDSLIGVAEQLNIPLACREGVCGSCRVRVISGKENLSKKTENEEMLGLEEDERLMCQANIVSGEVTIDPN